MSVTSTPLWLGPMTDQVAETSLFINNFGAILNTEPSGLLNGFLAVIRLAVP